MSVVSGEHDDAPRGASRLQVGQLALSHVLADGFVSFHLTLMPLLARELGFTRAASGFAISMLSITGNFGQPLVGHLLEQRRQKWVMIAGLLLAIVGASCMGLASSYGMLVVVLMCGGLGLAFYHPASAALVGSVAAAKPGLVTSLWSSAGSFGVFAGPVLIGLWAGWRGLGATPWAMVPGLVLVVPVVVWLRDAPRADVHRSRRAAGPTRTGAFALLLVQTVLRSITISAFLTYLSFYCQSEAVGMSPGATGFMVGIFGLMGVGGVLLGGHFSDLMPRRRIMVGPILAAPGALLVFVFWPCWYSAVALGIGGMLVWAGHCVNIVLAQEYMPRNTAMASGMVIGGAWGISSLTMPFWGWIGDVHGDKTALTAVLLTAPILAAIMAIFQPHTERTPRVEEASP